MLGWARGPAPGQKGEAGAFGPAEKRTADVGEGDADRPVLGVPGVGRDGAGWWSCPRSGSINLPVEAHLLRGAP